MKTKLLITSLILAATPINAEGINSPYDPQQLQQQIISQGQVALKEMSESFRNKQQWKTDGESHMIHALKTLETTNNPVVVNCNKIKDRQPAKS